MYIYTHIHLICLRRPETSKVKSVNFDIFGIGRLSMKNYRKKIILMGSLKATN